MQHPKWPFWSLRKRFSFRTPERNAGISRRPKQICCKNGECSLGTEKGTLNYCLYIATVYGTLDGLPFEALQKSHESRDFL